MTTAVLTTVYICRDLLNNLSERWQQSLEIKEIYYDNNYQWPPDGGTSFEFAANGVEEGVECGELSYNNFQNELFFLHEIIHISFVVM